MAKFEFELPKEILRDFEKIYQNTDKIFGGMTQAGAKVAYKNVLANVPKSWRGSEIMNNFEISKVYKTPSDGGINTKVIITGYFYNRNGVLTPAPLVANVFEYGSTKQSKQPFFRKSFRRKEIETAMLTAQKKLSGGLLE